MASKAKLGGILASLIIVVMLASVFAVGTVNGAPTTVTAYKSQIAVNIKNPYSASSWTDTPTVTDGTSGVTFAAKQNGTGWLFFLEWQTSGAVCSDSSCYGGIELGPLTNNGVMGNPNTPTVIDPRRPCLQGRGR